MSLAPARPVLPIFRLLIPTVQLSVISRLFPQLRVLEAHGQGSLQDSTTTTDFDYGIRVHGVTGGRATLDFVWNAATGPVTTADLWNAAQNTKLIEDISLYHLTYYRMATINGQHQAIRLRMGKNAAHPEVYERLVVNGNYPFQETVLVTKQLKRDLSHGPDRLSPEQLKRIRPTCLVLYDVVGNRGLLYDGNAIWSLREGPPMLFVREIHRRWDLYDYEYPATAPP